MIFSGQRVSEDIRLSKINTIQSLVDGISITRSGKQKAEHYIGIDVLAIELTITPDELDTFEQEVVKWKMSGVEMKSIIQKLLQQ